MHTLLFELHEYPKDVVQIKHWLKLNQGKEGKLVLCRTMQLSLRYRGTHPVLFLEEDYQILVHAHQDFAENRNLQIDP